jgi:hypothetical protein
VVPADAQDRDALTDLVPVLVALTLADGYESFLEVDILELQGGELAEAYAGLQEGHDDRVVRGSSEASYSSAILSAVAHSGDPNRLFRLALDLRVQEERLFPE